MPDRYHCAAPLTGPTAVLKGPEAHHLAHVMRAAPGTLAILFDGRGVEALAEVTSVRRDRVELAIRECRAVDREARRRLTLAVALPKGDRQRVLVEKAVELGVARLVPLVTERGVAQPTDSAIERLRRTVIESSKQCGRNVLMEVTGPATLAESGTDSIRWIAHPGEGASPRELLAAMPATAPLVAAIGPEGGFTPSEVAAAIAAGWTSIVVGPRILRVETAALALAALATQ